MNQLVFDGAARQRMIAGANVLADTVRITLGPRGRFVALQRGAGAPLIANSGVTVAQQIELPDAVENLGASLMREVAKRTSETAGDGTTTATVLAQAMINEGLTAVAAGLDAMEIKRGIDQAVAAAVEALRQIAQPCRTDQEIAYIASISANNDPAIGSLISQAMAKVGREGAIAIEDGTSFKDELNVVQGLQFDRGYLSPYFVTDTQRLTAELEDPLILLCDKRLESVEPLIGLLDAVAQSGHALLVIADDVHGEILATLVVNSLRGTLKACAVKAPGFGEQRQAMLLDVAAITGATLIAEELGLSLDKARPEQLGHAARISVSRDKTTIVGGAGDAAAIASRVAQLRRQIDEAASRYDREKLEARLGTLSGGVALLRVGAHSELELKEKKGRAEDALHAARAALEEGIVAGGGVALLRVAATLAGLTGSTLARQAGIDIVIRALSAPLRRIVANGGDDPSPVLARVGEGTGMFGYNASSGEYGDLLAMGIIDPVKVTRLALQNAASIAGVILTTDCAVTHEAASLG